MAMTKTRSSGDEIPAQLEKVLGQPDVASELFFPIDRASWRERKRKYFVKWRDRGIVRSTIGGVRFQCSERAEPGTSAVTGCQNDVVRLVRSLAIMRQEPELAGAVLSKDVLLHRQLGKADGKRAKFGLLVPNNGRFRDDTDAARLNHRRIVRAIRRAGFKVIQPEKPFEPQTGMGGLQEWSSELRLRKRRNYWWLLLLLLPVLWVPQCDRSKFHPPVPINPESPTPFDMPLVETDGLILVLDESPSMKSAFPRIRLEAQRYLTDRKDRKERRSYIDMIRYSDKPRSILHGLQPLDDEVEKKLKAFLEEEVTGKDPEKDSQTNLQNAMEEILQEVSSAPKEATPVTVLILTDAKDDPTIKTLTLDDNLDKLKKRFDNVVSHVNATTPRLLPGMEHKVKEPNADEEGLAKLCEKLGGRFGPSTPKSGGVQLKLPPGSVGPEGNGGTGESQTTPSSEQPTNPSKARDGQREPAPESPKKGSGEEPQ
jgi:hypothetical protein